MTELEHNNTDPMTAGQSVPPEVAGQTPQPQPVVTQPVAANAAGLSATGLGIAGLVLGILAVPPAFIPVMNFLSLPFAIVGIILAAVGLSNVRKGKSKGKGIATAGVVLNIIAIGIFLVMYGGAAMVGGTAATTAATTANSVQESAKTSSQSTAVDENDAESAEATEASEDAEYKVTIGKASITEDYGGDKAVVISFKWKNNSDSTTSFASALYPKCFQDGVQLDTAIVSGLGDSDYLTQVKPGHGTTVKLAYKLENSKDPVEVEVGPLINFNDEVYATKTFNF